MTDIAPPFLEDLYPVPGDLVDRFGVDGHVKVPALASSDEAASYRPIIEELAQRTAYDRRPLSKRDTYGRAFLQAFNLWRSDPDIARFVLSTRFASVAASLLDVEQVRLYHDQALCKEPGGGRTPWHQDQFYWPMDTDRTVTMWMPLVDVPSEIGSMTFVSGSHRLGDLRGRAISDESDEEFTALIAEQSLATHTHGAMNAGDATFHRGWTIHSAGPNRTDLMRTVMTVIYMADGARVRDNLTEAQDFDRRLWLDGTDPGSLIDGDLNPVVGGT